MELLKSLQVFGLWFDDTEMSQMTVSYILLWALTQGHALATFNKHLVSWLLNALNILISQLARSVSDLKLYIAIHIRLLGGGVEFLEFLEVYEYAKDNIWPCPPGDYHPGS